MFSVLSEGYIIEYFINLWHLLREYLWIISSYSNLGSALIHLPYLQHSVLASSSQKLSIWTKFGNPYAIRMCSDTLYKEHFKFICCFFVKLRLIWFMNPGSHLKTSKLTVLHRQLLIKFELQLIHLIKISNMTQTWFTIISWSNTSACRTPSWEWLIN